ncbi:hypothetical protein [Trichlorobacter ammonificans]|uniref:DUF3987 domain-containing protein n=1 Tax=Trichlorobacter ammonificans TaxID=2916410 RepID=A0ABM9D916_9BACT|nr:hypothetical protein [Trichlorobacter ammonificans]CAH2031717.1 conserved protein of unknown function [Trichlorobacter ammonificans]
MNEQNGKLSAYFPGLVDVCKNDDGQLLYCTVQDGHLVFSDQHTTDTETLTIPDEQHFPFLLPRAGEVQRYYSQDDTTLYDDLLAYLKRFSALDAEQWPLVVYYIFLTYLHDHRDIDYCGYLLFYAVPERGKSRTGKSASYVSFRASHLIELREPIIFRYTENFHGTLFLDLMDVSKKAAQSQSEDLLLLRAEKGVKCVRVNRPDLGAFLDTDRYDIYGPTIIATNEQLHKILGTRCLPIIMPNCPGDYENPRPELGLELKERLTAWRAKHLFAALPSLKPLEGISGRLWDISKPLLQISMLVKRQSLELLHALRRIASDKIESRQDTTEGRIAAIVKEISEAGGYDRLEEWSISQGNILVRLNEGRAEGYKTSPQGLGLKLKTMSLRTRHVKGYAELMITRHEYRMLLEQNGFECRELQLSPNSLPEKHEEVQLDLREVESSRESGEGQGGNHDNLPF